MSIKLITAPAAEPVILAEAKLHCRVDSADDDTLITALIVAARELAEQQTGRALVTQTWELALDAFPVSEIELPLPPVQSIVSIKYLDSNGAEQTVPGADYGLDNYGSVRHLVILAAGVEWPATLVAANAVKVRFVAGYGAAVDVPGSIRQWMLLQIGNWYATRESVNIGNIVNEMPYVGALLDPYRVLRFG